MHSYNQSFFLFFFLPQQRYWLWKLSLHYWVIIIKDLGAITHRLPIPSACRRTHWSATISLVASEIPSCPSILKGSQPFHPHSAWLNSLSRPGRSVCLWNDFSFMWICHVCYRGPLSPRLAIDYQENAIQRIWGMSNASLRGLHIMSHTDIWRLLHFHRLSTSTYAVEPCHNSTMLETITVIVSQGIRTLKWLMGQTVQ